MGAWADGTLTRDQHLRVLTECGAVIGADGAGVASDFTRNTTSPSKDCFASTNRS